MKIKVSFPDTNKPFEPRQVIPVAALIVLRNAAKDEEVRKAIQAAIDEQIGEVRWLEGTVGIHIHNFPIRPLLGMGKNISG